MGIISDDSVIVKQAKNLAKMNLNALKKEAIKEEEKKVVQNQRDQMRAGRMGNGFLPDYSPKSQKLKDRSNYKATWPTMDLYDTSSFQDKMFLEIGSKSVIFDSKDSKTNELVKRYSEEIFEPDDKTQKEHQKDVTPTYNRIVHDEINK